MLDERCANPDAIIEQKPEYAFGHSSGLSSGQNRI
jgi:hypothetical protein